MSRWLRDYLYISLGGNRGGRWMTLRNLMLTMVLGGLWHGAAMNFVIWGAYHGALLGLARFLGDEPTTRARLWGARIVTFHLILFGWLLFRVPDMATFQSYVGGLLEFTGGSQLKLLFYSILAIAFLAHVIPKEPVRNWLEGVHFKAPVWFKAAAYAAGLVFFLALSTVSAPKFIYFQF